MVCTVRCNERQREKNSQLNKNGVKNEYGIIYGWECEKDVCLHIEKCLGDYDG